MPLDVDRVTVVWADNAIRNTWLQVTVQALFLDRVVGTDVFYFGHLAGETDGLRVTAADYSRTRAAGGTRNAPLTNAFDHNRDGFVNLLDANVARGNVFASLDPLFVPAAPVAAIAGMPKRSRYRPGLWLDRT